MTIAQTLPLADWWGMHGDVGAGWMILMMTVMVLSWGAIILGIVWLIRGATQSRSGPPESPATRESPVEILERRFAEGAISPEDYRARRDVLVKGAAEEDGARKDEPLTVR
jgi:putative membrane protein